jgi:hypothetical protein
MFSVRIYTSYGDEFWRFNVINLNDVIRSDARLEIYIHTFINIQDLKNISSVCN